MILFLSPPPQKKKKKKKKEKNYINIGLSLLGQEMQRMLLLIR